MNTNVPELLKFFSPNYSKIITGKPSLLVDDLLDVVCEWVHVCFYNQFGELVVPASPCCRGPSSRHP